MFRLIINIMKQTSADRRIGRGMSNTYIILFLAASN